MKHKKGLNCESVFCIRVLFDSKHQNEAAVAQVVESWPSNRVVGGSNQAPLGEIICHSVLEQDT